ncbi:hypothetical protein ABE437_10330 [Isoptericola cucumis]|uniref:hypothetical protein n=1 Tax=Isoptericola cucumis TaxID=1776856 RepID=UPI00320A97E7
MSLLRSRVRGVGAVGAVALLALLAAGCADPGAPGGSSDGSSASPTEPEPTEPEPTEPEPTEPEPTEPSDPDETPAEPDPAPSDLEPGESVRGLPDGVEGTMDAPVGVGWSPADGRLFVVTYGSSSCPRLAEATADWDDGHESVVVRLVDPPADKICTMDYMPTTSVVAVPDDVDASSPVPVRLAGEGRVEVTPRPAPGKPGPMAWQPAD